MRILAPIFSPAAATWGGMTRILAVARAAKQAGHEIAFCASGDQATKLHEHGYPVYAMPPTTLLGLPESLSRLLSQRVQRTSPPGWVGKVGNDIWLMLVVVGYGRGGYLRRLVAAELEAVQDFQPDVLFTDLDPGAFLLSAITNLPLAFPFQSIMETGLGSIGWRLMQRAMQAVTRQYSLPAQTPHDLAFGPRILKLIPSIPELDGEDPNRPGVYYVGHLLGDLHSDTKASFEPEPGRRYVFVYVGTGSVSLDRLQTVLPEVFPAGGDTLCLVGAQSLTEPQRIGNVEFRPYVPAGDVLPHCDWTICHGGQNTIIQSLWHGVPLIILPGIVFERRFNAERIVVAGTGLLGEKRDLNVAWLQAAMSRRAELAPTAASLGERIRSYGGPPAAIEAIEAWVSQQKREVV